jgi:hypothetical protein
VVIVPFITIVPLPHDKSMVFIFHWYFVVAFIDGTPFWNKGIDSVQSLSLIIVKLINSFFCSIYFYFNKLHQHHL